MVLIRRYPNGGEVHGPPYTQAEEDEFYRRVSGGPVAILRGPQPAGEAAAEPDPSEVPPPPTEGSVYGPGRPRRVRTNRGPRR